MSALPPIADKRATRRLLGQRSPKDQNVTLMAGLEIAIHFATDSSLAQTLNYLGSDAPPIKLAPLL